jgi:hypothetical protein
MKYRYVDSGEKCHTRRYDTFEVAPLRPGDDDDDAVERRMGLEGTHGVCARFQSIALLRAASWRLSLSCSSLERLELYASINPTREVVVPCIVLEVRVCDRA